MSLNVGVSRTILSELRRMILLYQAIKKKFFLKGDRGPASILVYIKRLSQQASRNMMVYVLL